MFPTAHSTIYTNDAGEVTGWDSPAYDDGPDPDDFYDSFDEYDDSEDYGPCDYCGEDGCDADCEPIRCEADVRHGGGVCQWRIPLNKECPNIAQHFD